jgi:predicted transcriptional regulator
MMKKILTILFSILALTFICSAQRNDPKEEPSEGLKETLAKWRIKSDKKEFEELQKKGQEAEKLVTELSESFTEKKQLSTTDSQKLAKLEKLVKKIRSEVGAENNDDDEDEIPKDLVTAYVALQEQTVKLLTGLKKATRHSISAIAIESSNSLLKIVKFIRLRKS